MAADEKICFPALFEVHSLECPLDIHLTGSLVHLCVRQ